MVTSISYWDSWRLTSQLTRTGTMDTKCVSILLYNLPVSLTLCTIRTRTKSDLMYLAHCGEVICQAECNHCDPLLLADHGTHSKQQTNRQPFQWRPWGMITFDTTFRSWTLHCSWQNFIGNISIILWQSSSGNWENGTLLIDWINWNVANKILPRRVQI